MEMGSSSEPISDSLDGLTFGEKIYFEDSTTSTASTTSDTIAGPPKKGKSLASSSTNINSNQQQISIPRCQVEGCKVDLTGAKAYYCRHKVCGVHSKSPKVVVAGIEQRFCQQCSRFHQLQEFDQGKRSCRRRLAGHNERRRKPPPGPSRYGRMSSSVYDGSSRFRGFLMDFSYPRPIQPLSGDHLWPRLSNNIHQYPASPNTASNVHVAQPYMHAMNHYSSELPPHEYMSGASADSSCALSLLSTQQPWGSNAPSVIGNRPPLLCSAIDGVPPPMAMTGGCLLHPYGFKNHHEMQQQQQQQHHHQHGMCLGQMHDGSDVNGQFSGELELALHGSSGAYDDHSAHGMNWSL